MKVENIILFLLVLTSTYYIYDKYKGKNTSRDIIIQESNPIKIETNKKNSIQKNSYVPSFEDDYYDNDDAQNQSEATQKKPIEPLKNNSLDYEDDYDDDDDDDDDLFL